MKRWLRVWILAALPAVAWGQASTGLPAPSANGIGGVPVPTLATGYLYYNSSTNSFVFQTPSGSGTVNNCAAAYAVAYYAGSGTAVSCSAAFTGLGYFSTGSAPTVATGAQIAGAIGSTAVANATSATSATSFTGSLSGDVTGTQSATTVGKINGGSVPASAKVLATNSSSQPVAASNTLGCLDGWDHLPCTVYEMGVTSESAVTGAYATAYTTPAAGVYRVSGNVYPTADGTTSYTVSLAVKQQQTGGDASHSLTIASASVGTGAGWNLPAALTLDLASNVAVTWETSGSGTNTGSVWNVDLIIERIK
jgi:hypothetical protein